MASGTMDETEASGIIFRAKQEKEEETRKNQWQKRSRLDPKRNKAKRRKSLNIS